jgi:hypothetical protein
MARSTAFDARPGQPEIHADLQDVAHQVRQEFADRLDSRQVDECLNPMTAELNEAQGRSLVPLLVRRYVREELQTSLGHP